MVAVVQLVERQIVILVVVGSSPIGHPIFKIQFRSSQEVKNTKALFNPQGFFIFGTITTRIGDNLKHIPHRAVFFKMCYQLLQYFNCPRSVC
jgi:hypothetical protein